MGVGIRYGVSKKITVSTEFGYYMFFTDFIDDVTHIKTGAGEWGERLLRALKQIDSELVFYMQEDFWCINDYELTDELLDLFIQYNMDQLHVKEKSHLVSLSQIKNNLYKFNQNYLCFHIIFY